MIQRAGFVLLFFWLAGVFFFCLFALGYKVNNLVLPPVQAGGGGGGGEQKQVRGGQGAFWNKNLGERAR